jgi:hypothetical protein
LDDVSHQFTTFEHTESALASAFAQDRCGILPKAAKLARQLVQLFGEAV